MCLTSLCSHPSTGLLAVDCSCCQHFPCLTDSQLMRLEERPQFQSLVYSLLYINITVPIAGNRTGNHRTLCIGSRSISLPCEWAGQSQQWLAGCWSVRETSGSLAYHNLPSLSRKILAAQSMCVTICVTYLATNWTSVLAIGCGNCGNCK